MLSSKILTYSSPSSNLLLIPPSIFFISVTVFFISDWFLFFLFIKVLTMFIYSSPEFTEHLYYCYFELFIE